MARLSCFFVFVILIILVATGCSGGEAITPDTTASASMSADGNSHNIRGMWQFIADPVEGTLDITLLRTGSMHLNALPFLEPPPFQNITLESLQFNGNILEADIGLTHPFLGLKQFTGFDVCGILITSGNVTGFSDPDLRMAGDGDTRLLNADGFSRWWNPSEFPVNNGTMFSYQDGLMGTKHSVAGFNCTLNGYKYFADELGPDDPINILTLDNRGYFSAGKKNVRHYSIALGAGLIFNYAVDANWKFPTGTPPYDVPGDFAPDANRPEAYRISINEIENSLYFKSTGGGNLKLEIDVWDWQNPEDNTVRVESPGNFDPVTSSTPIATGDGYATYAIDVIGAHPIHSGSIDLLICVESDTSGYGGLLPGKAVTAYFQSEVEVSGVGFYIEVTSPNGGETFDVGSSHEIMWDSYGVTFDVKIEYFKDNDYDGTAVTIIDSTSNDGSFMWDPVPDDPTATAKIRITDNLDSNMYDDSDAFFTIKSGEPETAEWNQLQNHYSHSGDIPGGDTFYPPLELDWNVSLSSPPHFVYGLEGTPIVGDGKFLVFYSDPDVTYRSWAECRSLEDGSYLWKFDLNPSLAMGPYISTQTGCYADGKFFVPGDKIRALDAETGDEVWNYEAIPYQTIQHGLVYYEDKLYVHINNQIHVIDPDNGDLLDTITTGSGGSVTFQPFTINNGWAFVQGLNKVYGLILATGNEQWNFTVDYSDPDDSVRNAPTVPGDGRVYFGSYNHYYYAVNQSDGSLVWKKPIHGGIKWVFDTGAYHDGKLFYGESQGGTGTVVPDFVCVNAETGGDIWTYPAPSGDKWDSWYNSTPIVVNDVVYVSCRYSGFFGFDVDNGDLLWDYQPTGDAQSDPVYVDGKLLFMDNDYKVYCFKVSE